MPLKYTHQHMGSTAKQGVLNILLLGTDTTGLVVHFKIYVKSKIVRSNKLA
jgi:hypothetical protein